MQKKLSTTLNTPREQYYQSMKRNEQQSGAIARGTRGAQSLQQRERAWTPWSEHSVCRPSSREPARCARGCTCTAASTAYGYDCQRCGGAAHGWNTANCAQAMANSTEPPQNSALKRVGIPNRLSSIILLKMWNDVRSAGAEVPACGGWAHTSAQSAKTFVQCGKLARSVAARPQIQEVSREDMRRRTCTEGNTAQTTTYQCS